jgi:tetratricopeptide (TPR) repeat protein
VEQKKKNLFLQAQIEYPQRAMAKQTKETDKPILDVEQAFDRTERYVEENKKSLIIIVSVVVGLVGLYFAWKLLYLKPNQEEAVSAMYKSEIYFANDSFNLAINGKGDTLGFAQIVDEYGITKSGNLAHYYLGISYLRTGKYQEAIDELKEFDADDQFISVMAIGCTGDAYLELGEKEEAISYYLKAAKKNANKFTSPYFLKKAGLLYEDMGNKEEARKVYEQIKVEFSESTEAQQIDKYIARASS